MHYYIYILYSVKLDRYYIGFSSNPESRLIKHKQTHKGFTGRAKDWEIVYTEEFPTKQQAMQRERELKSWKDRNLLEKLIYSR